MSMETNELLYDHIYPNIDRIALLSKLKPHRFGNYIMLKCPGCQEEGAAYIYDDGTRINCNHRNKCNYDNSLWDYVQQDQAISDQETLRVLADYAKITLPELSPDAMHKFETAQQEAILLRNAHDFFVKQLQGPWGQKSKDYLHSRGYSNEDIFAMELGHNPGCKKTFEYLKTKGYREDQIKVILPYLPDRDDHQITIPYRDYRGNLISIWGRLNAELNEDDHGRKYLPYMETSKASPLNMHKARRYDEIVIVEGFLDPLIATARGMDNVIGICGAKITNEQFNRIIEYKPERIFLCLDNDKAGIEGTENAIKRFNAKSVEVLVVALQKGFKDPDELIAKQGIEQFKIAVACSKSCGNWLASNIIEEHVNDLVTDVGRRKAINEIIKWFKILKDPLDQKDLRNSTSSTLNIPDEKWQAVVDEAQKKGIVEKEKTMMVECNEKIEQLANNGDIEGAKQELLKCAKEIEKHNLIQDQSFQQYIKNSTEEDLLESFKNMVPGIDTGYTIGTKDLILPGGAITILAGQTGHGKTTVLQNLSLGAIANNENLSVYYFSFEESAPFIQAQFLNIWINEELSEGNNRNSIIYNFHARATKQDNPLKYIKENKRQIFEKKKDSFFNDIMNKGRLKIFDPDISAEDLVALIYYLKKNTNVGLVNIDYIQLLRLREKPSGMSRHEELKEICQRLHSCSIETGLPILMAAQFNRKVENEETMNLLEIADSVDIARFGNVCIGIWNRNYNQVGADGSEPESEIFFKVLKGRYIGIGHNSAIPFNGNTGHIGDLSFYPAVTTEIIIPADKSMQQQKMIEF